MERIKRFGGLAILIIGLVLIFFYIKSNTPVKSRLEFTLPPGGVQASRIVLEYEKIEGGSGELMRRIETFPTGAVSKIIDEPDLPEGEYAVRVTMTTGQGDQVFERRYTHGPDGVTRFEVRP